MSIIQSYMQSDLATQLNRLFPMSAHGLYGSPRSLVDCAYLTPPALAEYAVNSDLGSENESCNVTNLEICPACFFQTSGTTSRAKAIPYSDKDLERQKQHEAMALRKIGLRSSDVVLSLGAPLPSISGWAIVNGSRSVGADVANTSQLDYDDVLKHRGRARRITTVIGTPIVVNEIGIELEREFGSVSCVFPNMRMGIIFGDVLPRSLREEIARRWGMKDVLSLYGTVEADVVATECPSVKGELEIMHERIIFELLPESELAKERANPGYRPLAIDLHDAPSGMIGEILITDVTREILPILRYRIGDIIEVFRNTGGHNVAHPSVAVLGRSRNTVHFDGVPFYEMQINAAVEAILGGGHADWRIEQKGRPGPFELSVVAPGRAAESLLGPICDAFVKQRPGLASVQLQNLLRVTVVDALAGEKVNGDAKARRVALLEV